MAGALRLPALQHNDGERGVWRVRFAYPPYNNDDERGVGWVSEAHPPALNKNITAANTTPPLNMPPRKTSLPHKPHP